MGTELTPDTFVVRLAAQGYTLASGYRVLNDPGGALLRRYLPVLAVIGAPYAGLGGTEDPLNPLDPVHEWHAWLRTLAAITDLQASGVARLALVRLMPPTTAQLEAAVQVGEADAFRVVHFVCYGERDMIYLEDEEGQEAYAVAEQLARLFKVGNARLVVLDGCFSRRVAQVLLSETPVEAVVGSRRRLSDEHARAFNTRFYADISSGAGVRAAYRAAIAELKQIPGANVERYELMIADDRHEVTLELAPPEDRARRPLWSAGPVRVIGLPEPVDVVGRRELIARLAGDLSGDGPLVVILHGVSGVGKSRVAAHVVYRLIWRFPDGVLWVHCTAVTTAQEILAQLAGLVDLPPHAAPDAIWAALAGRRVLLALDQIDLIQAGAEADRVNALVRTFAEKAAGRVLLTTHQPDDRLVRDGVGRVRLVDSFTPKAARTLAMRLAVAENAESIDVDTIDDFLEYTHNHPWLIARGVGLVKVHGIDGALDVLRGLQHDPQDVAANPQAAYISRRLERLAQDDPAALKLLVRAQGLPDDFDKKVALGLGGNGAAGHVQRLIAAGLLEQDETLHHIPPNVRAVVAQRFPLIPQKQDQIDRVLMAYYTQATPGQVPRERVAQLNNVRGLLARQLGKDPQLNPAVIAALLTAVAPAFAASGLGEEFAGHARRLRDLLPQGEALADLQVALGDMLGVLGGNADEAGWLLQVAVTLEGIPRPVQVRATLAYGRHLIRVGQIDAAADLLSAAFRSVIAQPDGTDVGLVAALAYQWGCALVIQGHLPEAVRRFEGALAGFARMQQPARVVEVQGDLGEARVRLGDLDRAEDDLRRALEAAAYLGSQENSAALRLTLARVYIRRADAAQADSQKDAARSALVQAERVLSDAVADLLGLADPEALAAAYHDLGRVQARLGRVADGAAHVARGRVLLNGTGRLGDRAEFAVTLGQLRLAQGDAVAAQTILHEALDCASQLDDGGTVLNRAAGVLVRVYQLRAKHAQHADATFRQQTREQAATSREQLVRLGLDRHVSALDKVIQGIALT